MKLSEAIRLGAMLRPKATGMIYKQGKSCAWGAAWEAVGGDIEHWDFNNKANMIGSREICERHWPELCALQVEHPVNKNGLFSLIYIIESLNDNAHNWTRERIADWVATVEPQEQVIDQPTPKEAYSDTYATIA